MTESLLAVKDCKMHGTRNNSQGGRKMNKGTKFLAGSVLAGICGVLGIKKYIEYQEKYPVLDELKSPYYFTMPAWTITPTVSGLMNKWQNVDAVGQDDVVTTTRKITSYDGEEIVINIVEPKDYDGEEDLPCLVYSHGGAYALGLSEFYFSVAAEYVKKVGCKVVLAHYRTMFEGSGDTCLEDCYAALKWTYDNAERLHIDKNRIAIAGDSAGGGITASLTHMVRDREEVSVCYQILIYPVTDSSLSTESMKTYTDSPAWNAKANRQMWKEMKKRISPEMEQYISALLCVNFSGLCNAYIEVEEFDCLHDEGVLYAEKLIQNGYEVQLNDVKGTYHGFDVKEGKAIVRSVKEMRFAALRKAFGL